MCLKAHRDKNCTKWVLLAWTLSVHWNVGRHAHMQSGWWYANIMHDRKQTKHENKYGKENVKNYAKTSPYNMSKK